MRSPTFTLVNPSPMGVVTGPLSATLFFRIESSSSTGSDWLNRLKAVTPASWRSHWTSRPATLKIRTTASVTSGPMPSPGISVMVCAIDVRACFGRARLAQPRREQRRDLLEQHAVVLAERRGPIAVDVDLAEDVAAAVMIGTTISDLVSMLHARYRGSAFTSSTMMVAFSVAAAPQMPRPSGMRVCGDGLPTNGPSTSSSPSSR